MICLLPEWLASNNLTAIQGSNLPSHDSVDAAVAIQISDLAHNKLHESECDAELGSSFRLSRDVIIMREINEMQES